MSWKLTFISEKDFAKHVRDTIQKYGDKLESFDLRRFNKNIVDPIKLIFDKTVYRASWEETIISGFFNIFRIVMSHRMAKKAAGMSFIKIRREFPCRTVLSFIPCMWR